MTELLLAERMPDDGRVLARGALELEHLSAVHPGWEFDGIDASAQILRLAEATTQPFAVRIRLHEGSVDSAPAGPFDAAVCLLTLHFLPAAERLDTLRHSASPPERGVGRLWSAYA